MVDMEYQIIAKNFELAGRASSDIKKTLKHLNFPQSFVKRVCAASYEAEINIVIHSFGGYALFDLKEDEVTLEFFDDGPGIVDIELALSEGYSTATEEAHANGFGAGMGLPNIKRLSDTFDIRSDLYGTHLIIKFILDRQNEK